MDKERATGLLLSAKVFELAWEVDCDDEGFYGQFAIVQSATNAEKEEEDFSHRCVAGELIAPTFPEAQLMAAAPDLARWGIAQTDEIERLRAEIERLQAELASLRALVGEVPRALVAGLPEVVSRLVEQAEDQTLPGGGGR